MNRQLLKVQKIAKQEAEQEAAGGYPCYDLAYIEMAAKQYTESRMREATKKRIIGTFITTYTATRDNLAKEGKNND